MAGKLPYFRQGRFDENRIPEYQLSQAQGGQKVRGMWIDNRIQPARVHVKLNFLQDAKSSRDLEHRPPGLVAAISDVSPYNKQVRLEGLRLKDSRDAREWWDKNNSKLHATSNVKHKSRSDTLLVVSWKTPESVADSLQKQVSSNEAGGGSSESGSSSHKTCTSDRDQFYWAALISQHTKSGQARRALRIFKEMREGGAQPSTYTYVAALKACSSLQDLESAKRIHSEVAETGLQSDVYVGSMLVDVYTKCGSLVDARLVFEKMPHRNVVSWTAMILGYAQMDEGEKALQLYTQMQEEGVAPDNRAFVGALKACSSLATVEQRSHADKRSIKVRCLEQVRAIHKEAVKFGSESAVYVGNMLVDAYAKCGSLVDARQTFENMAHRNVVSWNTMILGYAQMDKGRDALHLYARMQQEHVVMDDRTFVSALKACSRVASVEEGKIGDEKPVKEWCLEQVRAIHADVIKSRCESDIFVGNMLVDVYAKCGSLGDARLVFDRLPKRNVVSWTAMIQGYAQMEEQPDIALQLFMRMQQDQVVPDARAFVSALKACSSLAASDEGIVGQKMKSWCLDQVRTIHLDIVKRHLESDVHVGSMLVDVYSKCGSLEDARRIFEKIPHRNVVCWTAMILGYAQMENGEEALKLFTRMQQEGVAPDDRTYLGVLKACGCVAALEKGKELHAQISNQGSKAGDLFVGNAVIDMYGKCGSMVDAQQVFDALPRKDIVTWSALMAGYGRQGRSEIVLDLFRRMRKEGIQPNGITFVSVLSVCSHVGLWDEGWKFFEAMSRDFGITPTIEHYTCMIDLLGRAGEVENALSIAISMPFKPDAAVWETVLSACRKWNKVELGALAFDSAIRLNRNDSSAYVLMSSIYEAAHMWEEATSIRAMRNKTQTWKQQGQSSWTDMAGIVHTFVVGDQKDPERECVYAELWDLFMKMKEDDHVAQESADY